ncbi:MAG: thioredoxin-related protein [Arcticibacterium sp.]|jgi:thioredoxin-related protein
MLKKISLLLLAVSAFTFSSSFKAKTGPVATINWMSVEEAYAAAQKNPKKTIIDVYTGWCGWCKVMDKKTFTNPEVVKYVNENFYAVKLDAETQNSITLGTTTYNYNTQNRANDIAVALLQGKMSYPSIVYLDEEFNMIQPIPGYMEARAFHEVITFIGEDYHKKETFDAYKANTYESVFKASLTSL